MRLFAFACLSLLGCSLSSDVTHCADLTCASGSQCRVVAGASQCVLTSDVDACADLLEGDACDPDDPGRTCLDGVCIDQCGNGRIDADEECDDNNRINGDTCSAICLKEVCGNGALDINEECDSGPAGLSNDGCSSTCQLELPTWTQLRSGLTPRAYFALIRDRGRKQLVGFGGIDASGFRNDTWLLDDGARTWRATLPAVSPPPRTHHALAYDEERRRVVLFGGFSSDGVLGDTWEWDGTTWELKTPPTSPSPRRSAALVYDATRKTTLLASGTDAATLADGGADGLADVWEWNGQTWSPLPPLPPVPAGPDTEALDGFRAASGAHLPTRGVTLICPVPRVAAAGMQTQAPTYELDNGAWIARGTCPLGNHEDGGIAAQVRSNGTVTVHARTGDGEPHLWSDGPKTWGTLAADGMTTFRAASFASFSPVDNDNEVAMVFGGHTSVSFSDPTGFRDDIVYRISSPPPTWDSLDNTNRQPLPVVLPAFAYDRRHARAVMFGGQTLLSTTNETWEWSRTGWSFVTSTGPSARSAASLAYDSARDTYVLFGGGGDATTWELAEGVWTARTPAESPTTRTHASMVYDEDRGVTMMFGGLKTGATTDELWTWDGEAWQQLTPPIKPPARSHAAMGYDPVRKRVVLFAGQASAATTLDDTWEWDGATWTQMSPSVSPQGRSHGRLVYDPARGVLLLFGGGTFSTFSRLSDVWQWDGVTWTKLHEDPRFARFQHAAFFDTTRAGIVTFGGTRDELTGPIGETWMFRFESLEPRESCLAAADDVDGDTLAGCEDPDCWALCKPTCPPATSCAPDAPACGDGDCDLLVEDRNLCPADCG